MPRLRRACQSAIVVAALLGLSAAASFAGDVVQMNVSDAPLDQVLRMLSKAGNVNIVIPPELAGKHVHDLRLPGLPVEEALSTVLGQFGYRAVLENNAYIIRPTDGPAKASLIRIVVREISLLSVDVDRLLMNVPPDGQLKLPENISLSKGQFFRSTVSLLQNNTAKIRCESHWTAGPKQAIFVATSGSQPKVAEAVVRRSIDATSELLPTFSSVILTPDVNEDGTMVLSVLLETEYLTLQRWLTPTKVTVDIPKLAVTSNDELWVRGWKGLAVDNPNPPGSETVLVLQTTLAPPGQ